MLEAVARIIRAVRIPVSADMESGYGEAPDDIAGLARRLASIGAVGFNLEDSSEGRLHAVDRQVAWIRAAKTAAPELVLNARTDGLLFGLGTVEETIERANAYRAAGADCLFVPGVKDAPTIERLAREIKGPINVLAVPGAPPVKELARLGVRRVSVGSGPMRAAMMTARRIARELLDEGSYVRMGDAMSYVELNQLLLR
jgi:2-methylisocitrate lyase-like PEP mutase family enzyme